MFAGRGVLVDTVAPPAVFLVSEAIWDLQVASYVALGVGLALGLVRLAKSICFTDWSIPFPPSN